MPLPVGTLVGHYRILSLLGAGGMGEVYRARDTQLGREVAIKTLLEGFAEDTDRIRRFRHEAKLLATLNHPNVVQIYESGEHEGSPYLVMELLTGGTLRQRLRGRPLPLRQAVDFAREAAQGLAAAHGKGILHRDLKPENLFITAEGRVKVLDFGLAKAQDPRVDGKGASATEDLSEPGQVVGTMKYMSPEQMCGYAIDARADLFSLVVVLWEMLTGEHPFVRANAVETLHAILKEDPPELAPALSIPPALERILRGGLAKEPSERFHSAHDLAFALEGLSGTSSGSLSRAPQVGGRRWGLRAGAALAGFLLLGVLGFLAGAPRRSPDLAYHRLTYRRGAVTGARFMPDGQSVVVSAAWDGGPSRVYLHTPGKAEGLDLGVAGTLLSVSRESELAVQLPQGNMLPGVGTLASFPLGQGAPKPMAEGVLAADWRPRGGLALHRASGNLAFQIEFPSGTVVCEASRPGPIGTSQSGGEMRVSPDGAWVAYFNDDHLWAVNLRKELLDLGPAKGFNGLAWGPSGRELWFALRCPTAEMTSLEAVTLSGRRRTLHQFPGELKLEDVRADGRVLAQLKTRFNHLELRDLRTGDQHKLGWLDAPGGGIIFAADGVNVLFEDRDVAGEEGVAIFQSRLDGSSTAKIGSGELFTLSPDGASVVVAQRHRQDPRAVLALPLGSGEARELAPQGVLDLKGSVQFFPDGRHLLALVASSPSGSHFVQYDTVTRQARPVGPANATHWANEVPLSPDGQRVLCVQWQALRDRNLLFDLRDGTCKDLPGATPEDIVMNWSRDGRSVFAFRRRVLPAPLYRLEVATGRRTALQDLKPLDPAGVLGLFCVRVAPDEKRCAFAYVQTLSELFLIDGLR